MSRRNPKENRPKLPVFRKVMKTARKAAKEEEPEGKSGVTVSKEIDTRETDDIFALKKWALINGLITPEVHRLAVLADADISKPEQETRANEREPLQNRFDPDARRVAADIFRHLGWISCVLRDQDTAEEHFHTASQIIRDTISYHPHHTSGIDEKQRTSLNKIDQQPAPATMASNSTSAFMSRALTFHGLLNSGEITNAEFKDSIVQILSESATHLKKDRAYAISILEVTIDRSALAFAHAAGDYIPRKIEADKNYYEAEFLSALNQLISQEGAVVDIGANIGNHTVYFAKSANRKVIAFEPEPLNHLCLLANIALNDIAPQVHAHEIALGKDNGSITLTMAIDGNHGSFTRLVSGTSTDRPPEICNALRTEKLDSVLQEHHREEAIALLKIDVEGMELDVLKGSIQTIKSYKPIIACECSTESQLKKVEELLEQLGYANVRMMNATPTFIFVTLDNMHHRRRLLTHLREKSMHTASRAANFSHPS